MQDRGRFPTGRLEEAPLWRSGGLLEESQESVLAPRAQPRAGGRGCLCGGWWGLTGGTLAWRPPGQVSGTARWGGVSSECRRGRAYLRPHWGCIDLLAWSVGPRAVAGPWGRGDMKRACRDLVAVWKAPGASTLRAAVSLSRPCPRRQPPGPCACSGRRKQGLRRLHVMRTPCGLWRGL